MNTYGIERSKPVFALVGGVVTAIANIDTNQDGKVSLVEGINATQSVAFRAISTFKGNLKDLRNELTDLDTAEKATLNQVLAEELQMRSAKVEKLTERGIAILVDIIDFVIDAQKPEEAFAA